MADITITAANVVPASGATIPVGTAGETITAGKALYLKASDSRLWLAQCDGTAAEAAVVGIALSGASAGQPLPYVTAGTMNIGGTTSKADVYCLSATAGGIAPQADLTSGHRIVFIAYATATDGTVTLMIKNTGAVV
jgi:hypothetical protein